MLCHSGKGFGGLSANMHAFVTDHIIRPIGAARPRPVLYNSWEGCTFDFSQRLLLSLANGRRRWAVNCSYWTTAGSRDGTTTAPDWEITL